MCVFLNDADNSTYAPGASLSSTSTINFTGQWQRFLADGGTQGISITTKSRVHLPHFAASAQHTGQRHLCHLLLALLPSAGLSEATEILRDLILFHQERNAIQPSQILEMPPFQGQLVGSVVRPSFVLDDDA
jgi:hypothetical protein